MRTADLGTSPVTLLCAARIFAVFGYVAVPLATFVMIWQVLAHDPAGRFGMAIIGYLGIGAILLVTSALLATGLAITHVFRVEQPRPRKLLIESAVYVAGFLVVSMAATAHQWWWMAKTSP